MTSETRPGRGQTSARWQRVVRAWRRSGKTAAEFARERDVAEATLRWWAWRLARDVEAPTTEATGEGMALVPVRIVEGADRAAKVPRRTAAAEQRDAQWTLRTSRGEITVYAVADSAVLRAAVAALIGGAP